MSKLSKSPHGRRVFPDDRNRARVKCKQFPGIWQCMRQLRLADVVISRSLVLGRTNFPLTHRAKVAKSAKANYVKLAESRPADCKGNKHETAD